MSRGYDKLGFNCAFPSGEGGPRAVDEENTACANNRLFKQYFVCKFKKFLKNQGFCFTRKPLA
jgi:hypothetical protein